MVTVAEETPLSYKLRFATSGQALTTPNLFAPASEYHADLSAVGSALVIPLKDLELSYQTTSATALRITMAPRDAAAPVLVDLRRASIYNGSTVETTTLNGSTVSGRTVVDEIVYTNSQETHQMVLRQQDQRQQMEDFCRGYGLTEREREILRLILAGKDNLEISEELQIKMGTVKAHVHNIFAKLNISRRSELMKRFLDYGPEEDAAQS